VYKPAPIDTMDGVRFGERHTKAYDFSDQRLIPLFQAGPRWSASRAHVPTTSCGSRTQGDKPE